jgi:hypothetical protein
MSRCKHQKLILLGPENKKLRCRHCHLTIDEKELPGGHCPECYAAFGVKRRDFETLEPETDGKTRYACEICGAIITG